MPKSVVTVDTTAGGTEIVPAGSWNFIALRLNTGSSTIYLDLVGDSVALTTSNGIVFNDTDGLLVLKNEVPRNAFANGIKGIHASTSADVTVHYY